MSGTLYFASAPVPRPVGGLQVIADLVALLRDEGFEAVQWYPDLPGTPPLADSAASVVASELQVFPEDLLVFPGAMVRPGADPAPLARKTIFNQNHFFTFMHWQELSPYPGWRTDPDVWVVSRESQAVLGRLLPENPPRLIPLHTDPALFRPGVREQPVISWMPRKRPHEESLITRLLLTDARTADVELHEIYDAPRDEVACVLSRTSVFLALGHTESFGLPVAEALMSGCLVVGYPGGGGEHLFEAPGAWLVPEQRPLALVEKALQVLTDRRNDSLGERNRDWIRHHYSREATRTALLGAVRDALRRPGGAGIATHPLSVMSPLDASFTITG